MRTFSLYIHSGERATPSLAFEMASDESAAQLAAARVLAESPTRLLVEVCEEDRFLFTLDREGCLSRSPPVGGQPSDVWASRA
jgi:hypothetical protein